MATDNLDNLIKASVKPGPFFKTKVKCPVCGAENEQVTLKTHLFTERDLDIDLRPQTIIWLSKDVRKIFPRMYYMWHCTKCYFTASHLYYKNPVEKCTLTLSKFKTRLISLCWSDPEIMAVAKMFSMNIDFDNLDFFQAIKLHLLAVFELQLIHEIASKDAMNLGRYCLRLAWLYRDITERPDIKKVVDKKLRLIIAAAKKKWPDIPGNEEDALKMAVRYYRVTHEQSYMVSLDVDEIMLFILIARIYLKLDQLNSARKTLLDAKEKAIKFEEKRLQEENSKLPDTGKLAQLSTDSRKIEIAINEVQNIVDDILQEKEKRELKNAKTLLLQLKDKKISEIRKILLEKEFSINVIDMVAPEKKGFLGIFK
ncbi:MAG: DUF2225 domain-containing protein [Proteobacteria bacterium]|nr:DUF2225 domain-containing protein [Pseudomonadota bacterium]